MSGGAILATLAVTAIFTSPAALAACSTTNPSDGQTVNCTGTETTPIGDPFTPADQVTLDVAPGASISVADDQIGITLGAQNTIVNNGTIRAGNAVSDFTGGIFLLGDGNVITNNGSIIAGNSSGPPTFGIVVFGDHSQIVNNGLIQVGNGFDAASPAQALRVENDSQVTNAGRIVGGNFSYGIFGCCNNVIHNTATGSVTLGDGSYGIGASDGNRVTNDGTVTVGNSIVGQSSAIGIIVENNNIVINAGRISGGNGDPGGGGTFAYGIRVGIGNTVTNSGTVTVGEFARGIGVDQAFGGANTIINEGTIIAGNRSFGIEALFSGMSISNTGTITVGNAVNGSSFSAGIVFGSGTASNSGSIIVGNGDNPTQAYGIWANGDNAIISNSGAISGGSFSTGIAIINSGGTGNNTSITNSGLINVGANGTGIDIGFGTTGATLTNSGTVTAGADGFGINLQGAATLVNSGTIRALGGTANAVHGCNCAPSNVTNAGIVDGRIVLEGGGTVINSGLITITASDATQAVGIVHIAGDSFTQTASGTLALRVTRDGRSDTVGTSSATSTVVLAGALRVLMQPGLYANTTTYNNVVTSGTSGSLTGQFSSVTTTSPFFTATAVYNAFDVQLTLTRIAFNALPNLTPNQRAVGTVIENAYSPNLTGNAATFYSNLFASNSLASAFDQLSGQGVSASQGAAFGAASQFGSTMFGQGLNGDNPNTLVFDPAPLQYAPVQKPRGHEAFAALPAKAPPLADLPGRWRAWSAGFGSDSRWSGDAAAGIASQKSRTYGGVIGVDHQLTRDFLIGIAAGGSETNFSASDIATSGRATGGHVGIYAVKTWNAFYTAASFSYARFANSTTRTITGVGPTETATGSFSSDFFGGRIELGWKQASRGFFVTPFVAVEPSALYQHGFIENSVQAGGVPGILGLTFASKTTTSLPTFVGAQFDTRHSFANGWVLSPFARVSWVHEFRPDRQVSASFVTLPGAAFTVDGARAASDSARLDTGARLTVMPGKSVFANFTGEWSNRSTSYGAAAGFRAAW